MLCLNGTTMTRGGRIVRSKLDPAQWDQLLVNRLVLERFVQAEAPALKELPIQVDIFVSFFVFYRSHVVFYD